MKQHREISAIILAGGLGSRLQGVRADCPKPLIPCAGRPFIEWVLQWFRRQGIQEFVVSLGHLADVAERYFTERAADGVQLHTVVEPNLLGTAGALRFAWNTIPDRPVLVTNGDSLLLADLEPVWSLWDSSDADGILVGVPQLDASRYGTLAFNAQGRLLAFEEKRPGRGVINAGIYLFRPELLAAIPAQTPLSLERDVFPTWLREHRRLQVCVVEGPFLDIGLPETLAQADDFLTHQWIEDTSP